LICCLALLFTPAIRAAPPRKGYRLVRAPRHRTKDIYHTGTRAAPPHKGYLSHRHARRAVAQ